MVRGMSSASKARVVGAEFAQARSRMGMDGQRGDGCLQEKMNRRGALYIGQRGKKQRDR